MISTTVDDYINEYRLWNTVWCVTLNNGQEIFDDNGRRDKNGHIMKDSWLRLKEYCDSNNLWIDNIYFKFRSHTEQIEKSDDGYFLKRGILGSPGNQAIQFMIIGNVKNNSIFTTKWRVPELIPDETGIRPLAGNEGVTILKKE